MKVSEIKPNPGNPRIIRDEAFKKLVNSIKEFPKMMALRPIVVDSNMVVLGGNMRLKAIKEAGFKEIPDTWVKRADELTEAEKKRFIIADNVSGGEWNWDELAANWDNESLSDWGLEIEDQTEPKGKIEEKEITGFQKTHVLISFEPSKMMDIQEYLQLIKDIPGIEYEQSSN